MIGYVRLVSLMNLSLVLERKVTRGYVDALGINLTY
jgi:hypothetical protein